MVDEAVGAAIFCRSQTALESLEERAGSKGHQGLHSGTELAAKMLVEAAISRSARGSSSGNVLESFIPCLPRSLTRPAW